jgi:rfaE bifunctional protein nucleotidyltransferase chain/domain
MHAGHLQIIFEASTLGDVLIVALNSDSSIKKYKSEKRPIIPLEYRLQMMSALAFVDYVTWFEETDPIEFLKKVVPDVHVNGADWGKDCIESLIIKQLNATLHIARFVEGLSTTDIIKKIKDLCD